MLVRTKVELSPRPMYEGEIPFLWCPVGRFVMPATEEILERDALFSRLVDRNEASP